MKIFSIDNPVFAAISRLGDMFILSFLWLLTSLPVFTIGASTTAAYDCAFKIIRARDTSILKDYFRHSGAISSRRQPCFLSCCLLVSS